MLIFNPIQDLYPSDTFVKKLKSDEKNSSYHLDTDGGRTDGQTDGRTDEQGESSIPLSTSLRGVFSAANLALAGFPLTNALGESMPSRH